jgi:rubrerythrin
MNDFQTSLAGAVSEMAYAKNHHWLKLTDGDGNATMLIEHGLVKWSCQGCKFLFFTAMNPGRLCCPSCGGAADPLWVRPQVSLVPEDANAFHFVKTTEG